jgi:predicted dehydrogenase
MSLRIIQVGLGGWGRNWARTVISQNKDVEVVAYVDTIEAMRTQAQTDLKVPATLFYPTLEEALTAVDCDAVIITADLAGHVPVALTALQAGKHVLLEKPFAPTLAEAQQLIDVARQQQRILMISQNYRFYPAVQAVIELIREQTLGPVGTVTIDFRRYANTDPKEGHKHYTIWQPLLVDMSIHHFDLMRAVLGQEATQIICQTWNPTWSNFTENAAGAATITFEQGVVVSYRGNWVSTAPQTSWAGEWHVECAKGEIIWSSRDEPNPDYVLIRPLNKKAQQIKLPDVPLRDRHGSLNAFVQAVRTGQEPATSGRDNFNTLALMLAAVESATHNGQLTKPLLYAKRK